MKDIKTSIKHYLDNPQCSPSSLLREVSREELELFMEQDWNSFVTVPEQPPIHLLTTLRKKIRQPQPGRVVRMVRQGLAIAASVLILLGLSYIFFLSEKTVTTSNNLAEIELSDGSQITLGQNSSLTYPRNFWGRFRSVKLTGTGYFEVARNIEKPFIVYSDEIETEVLGTSFIISEWDSSVTVKVITGKVGVRTTIATSLPFQKLMANDKLIYNFKDQKFKLYQESSPNDLAWKTGILTFSNTPVEKVIEDIAHVYQTKLSIPPTMAGIRVTARFEKQPFSEVAEELSIILNANIELKDNIVYFYEK